LYLSHKPFHFAQLIQTAFLYPHSKEKEDYLCGILTQTNTCSLTLPQLQDLIACDYNVLFNLFLDRCIESYSSEWERLVEFSIDVNNVAAIQALYPSTLAEFQQQSTVDVEPHIQRAIRHDHHHITHFLLHYTQGPSLAYFLYEAIYESNRRTKVMEALVPLYFNQVDALFCMEKQLLKSIWYGEMEEVERLLAEEGMDVNLDYWNRGSPLYLAILGYGGKDMVELLLHYGADITRKPFLRYACEQENLEIVELLLRTGLNPNQHLDAVEAALSHGSQSMLDLYVQYGLDQNLLCDNRLITNYMGRKMMSIESIR
jgi:hypothetical protein